ncbi:MAG: hypothetical protein QOH61_2359 [Chloroflexota bacterium]|jgi:DNA-binding transcriptional ArsR family regulator|nr:hypothetical protein [Chloroflexota bacterium]
MLVTTDEERIPHTELSNLVEFFRALADPVRLEMVRCIARDGEVACTTFEGMFAIAKSTISYHIRMLRMTGMITVRKDGPFYHYQLVTDTFDQLAPHLLESLVGRPPEAPIATARSRSASPAISR